MKKAIKVFSLLTVICSLLTIVTCSSGNDTATLSIRLSDLPGKAAKAVSVDQLTHVIVLSGPADTQTLTITGSGTATATVAVGLWSIRVTAYYGEEVYAVGNATAEVRAGRNTDVSVHMTVVYKEPGSTTPSGGGGNNNNNNNNPGTSTLPKGAGLSEPLTEDVTLRTPTSITLKEPNLLQATGQKIEYAWGLTDDNPDPSSIWQEDPKFTLTPYTTYYFFARSKANTAYEEGAPIHSGPITIGDLITDWIELRNAILNVPINGQGTILLDGVITTNSNIQIDGNRDITLLPNGNVTIDRVGGTTDKFFYAQNGKLTLGEEGMAGSITLNGQSVSGGSESLIEVGDTSFSSELTMFDNVTLKNNNKTSGGGGAVLIQKGTFEMLGGNIIGNTAVGGGGVFISPDGEFKMRSGTIGPDNKATGSGPTDGGGGVYSENGFIMSGGEIIGNIAEKGGGVYVNAGIMTMVGGIIGGTTTKANIANSNSSAQGGGAYVGGSGSLQMTSNAEISGNTATSTSGPAQGGGVYFDSTSPFDMHSGNPKINGNTAEASVYTAQGGGVYLASGNFTMDEGEINGNTATGGPSSQGGGVYVGNVGTSFTKSAGVINGHGLSNLTPIPGNNAVYFNGSFAPVVPLATGPGHAVYVYDASTPFGRNDTASATDDLDSASSGPANGWDFP